MFLFIVLVSCLAVMTSSEANVHRDYLVIGAGPAGLQMGFFLQRAGRDYAVLERNNVSGSFFERYPRHDKLISINKRYTGKTNKEFNLRHDWNSLLSDDDDLLFTHYSSDFFPHRQTMLSYLANYSRTLHINVVYDTRVSDVHRGDDGLYHMTDQRGARISCRTLIVATGLSEPTRASFPGSEHVEDYDKVSIKPDDFRGQNVLILGRGNSAFEVAERIYGSTSLVHMLSRSRIRLSWETHYVGDLRAVNTALLDTYQLKSLDGVLEAPLEEVRLTRRDGRLHLSLLSELSDQSAFDNFALREPYDRVIGCLGWHFDDTMFSNGSAPSRGPGRLRKFPLIQDNYESVDHAGLFFAGTLTHSLDFRLSAGGFIHGFRYTTRALHRLLEWKNHAVAWPSTRAHITHLLSHVIRRVNEASGLYQMFYMLADVVLLSQDGQNYEYMEEFPARLLHQVPEYTGRAPSRLLVIVLEYGANFSGPGHDIFHPERATGEPSEGHRSNFLHPVLYYYDQPPSAADMRSAGRHGRLPRPARLHHVVEDFLTSWSAPSSHRLPLRRFLESILDIDQRHFFTDQCLVLTMTSARVAPSCQRTFSRKEGLAPPMGHVTSVNDMLM